MKLSDDIRDFVSLCHRGRPELSPAALREHLVLKYGDKLAIPSVSSLRAILEERGFVKPPPLPEGKPLDPPIPGTFAPNDVWCVDLLGPTLSGAGQRLLTVAVVDAYTRYLLRLEVIAEESLQAQLDPVLRSAFRAGGMPAVLRVRPVPPFQIDALQGLSALGVWLLRCRLVLDRRPDARFVSVPFRPPAKVDDARELLRLADAFRKQHNAREVIGYRASPVRYPGPTGTLIDLREWFMAESKPADKKGNVRWAGFRLALGAELATLHITFAPAEHPRFTEVKLKSVPLGLLDHARPWRGLIPAPILGRLAIEYPYIDVDWEPILVEDLAREVTAATYQSTGR